MSACQFYRPGQLCRAGFPLGYPSSSACTGRACMSCGRPNEITPPCQDEDIDPRWLDGSGKPRYALQGINHAELSAQPGAQIRQIPANLLERLHHHAVDKSNTAFARSTMHELAAYLDPKQHNDGGADE